MKKGLKGVAILSICLLLAGCSCNNNTNNTSLIELQTSYDANKVYDDVSDNFSELYNTAVKSTVRVIANTSLGSGVVYKEEGNYAYILTNAHVLTDKSGTDNYSNIEIVFSNYARVRGTYIYLDKNEDVAVIRVAKSDNYTVASIVSDDSSVNTADTVFSIGNPNGNYFSVTEGVISANRLKTTTDYISGTSTTTTYVYNSTATINPGNSGGPMFNSNGEVIAINTMQPSSDDLRNFNYSIPINYFIKVADYLVTNRTSYKKSYLNLEVKSICEYSVSDKSSLGITLNEGVYVTSSSETGISTGRIITHVNGVKVSTSSDYEFELLKYSSGQSVSLTVIGTTGINETVKTVTMK